MYRKHIIATLVLLVLDFVWIWKFMGARYSEMVPNIQCGAPMSVRTQYAALSYLLMVVGLNLFVLPRIRKGSELPDSLLYGFGFGIVLYGVYDFTAAAILRDWDIQLATADILWGGTVYFLAALAGSLL